MLKSSMAQKNKRSPDRTFITLCWETNNSNNLCTYRTYRSKEGQQKLANGQLVFTSLS